MKKSISILIAVLILAFVGITYGQDSVIPDGEYNSEAGATGEGPFPYGRFTIKGSNISYMGPNLSSGRGMVITEGKYEINGKEMKFINNNGKVINTWTFVKKSENVYVIDNVQFTKKQ